MLEYYFFLNLFLDKGVALDTIISHFNYLGKSVYGPSTFAVMASLGWVTAINRKSKIVFYPYDSRVAGMGNVPPFNSLDCGCEKTCAGILKEVGKKKEKNLKNDVKSVLKRGYKRS